MKKRILLIGGGSGGHVTPNLAIADVLSSNSGSGCGPNGGPSCGSNCCLNTTIRATKRSDGPQSEATGHNSIELLYIGSRRRLDRELVESAGIKFKAIFTGKLRRYFSWQNFIDPIFVIIGFFQSLYILIRFWPHVVFSKGGFVSVPVVFAAFILRRPIILHEADSVMGLANKIVSIFAGKVCISFPNDIYKSQIPNNNSSHHFSHHSSHDSKYIFTGNPIRTSIKDGDPEKGYKITGLRKEKPIVLVWGGSQGAKEINDMVVQEFENLKNKFQLIHITGKGKQMDIQDESYIQYEYIGDELKHIYAITDVVVGRAGANSLYELAYLQKPNILIPLQNPDQINNAKYFESKNASIVLRDQSLHEVLNTLWSNSKKIDDMKKSLAAIAKPEAAEEIANLIFSF